MEYNFSSEQAYKEEKDISDKIADLKNFVNNSILYEVLSEEKKELIMEKLIAMNNLKDILQKQIYLE